MKTRLTLLTLLLPLCLMAQAPPVLRQALTTNTAPVNPSNPGQIPVWTGTSWIFTTNLPGIIASNISSTSDFLWTNVAAIGTFFLTPTMAFTNENVAISNLYLLSGGLYNEAMRAEDGGNALQIGPSTLDWPNGVWLNNGKHELVFTNVDLDTSMIIPSDGGFRDDMVYEIGSTNGARFALIATPRVLAGAGENLELKADDSDVEIRSGNTIFFYPTTATYSLDTIGFFPNDVSRNLGDPGSRWLNFWTMGIQADTGITNNGTYQHSVGAFTGALFVSSNANGVAYWTTNVNNIGVTNLSVYNNVIFNGSIISNFNRDILWTNDTVVTKGSLTGLSPRFALRWGSLESGSEFWNTTNVGFWSVAMGSNVMARALGSTVHGIDNVIHTNALHAVIGGGRLNFIETNSFNSVIGGGLTNLISGFGSNTVIAGGRLNLAQMTGAGAGTMVIGGGQSNNALTNYATISGGFGNIIRGEYSAVAGGINNLIGTDFAVNASRSGILSGEENNVNNGAYGVIGGGYQNKIGGTSTSGSFGVIGGGDNNRIAPTGTGTSTNAVIGGGADNTIGEPSHGGVIAGGFGNTLVFATNAVISGGIRNQISGTSGAGRNCIIAGGTDNVISGTADHSFILGNSNQITVTYAGVIGQKGTNVLAKSIDIAPNLDATKSTFTASNTVIRTSLATVPGAVVTLTADNQVVDATQRSYVRLASDNATPSNRDFVLTGTNVVQGARLTLEWTDGTNAGQIVDNAANSGGGNTRLSADWVPGQNDTLELIFNGTDWIQVSRADN